MVWDPTGERLAVIIRGESCPVPGVPAAGRERGWGTRESLGVVSPAGQPEAPGSQVAVAVFRTRNSPVFELLPW